MEQHGNKLKILFIITKSNFGGAQRYVFDLATQLSKDEFEVSVALGGSGVLKDKLVASNIPTASIEGLERDISILKEIKAFLNILKIIKETKPDIIHLNSSKAGGLGGVAGRLYNITAHRKLKIIFSVHGFAFKEKRKPIVRKIIEYASWLTIVLSHQTIVVSNDDREKASRFLLVQPKITTIENGIDSPILKNKAEARKIITEKMRSEIPEGVLWVGTVAELHKNKGLEYAISAVSLMQRQWVKNHLVYVIVGGGEERMNLEAMIQRERLANIIFLTGNYPGASELLNAFDIFLLPSLKEGLPYALLEAGRVGLPTIGTNVGDIAKVIDDMKSGIVVKEKRPKEIADALTFLIENEQKRKEFGQRLLKTVETKYTLERMVKETIGIYRKI